MRVFLFPFALLYGLVVHVRNKLFDWNIVSSKSFSLPVIA
ncbi:MAG: tetraacyldisaccharide 4'-kinase, partial [Bacteroidales bacterium]|nr:tetraacyldisaccharide 4'-kinase [Bacteroidales bacterium]